MNSDGCIKEIDDILAGSSCLEIGDNSKHKKFSTIASTAKPTRISALDPFSMVSHNVTHDYLGLEGSMFISSVKRLQLDRAYNGESRYIFMRNYRNIGVSLPVAYPIARDIDAGLLYITLYETYKHFIKHNFKSITIIGSSESPLVAKVYKAVFNLNKVHSCKNPHSTRVIRTYIGTPTKECVMKHISIPKIKTALSLVDDLDKKAYELYSS